MRISIFRVAVMAVIAAPLVIGSGASAADKTPERTIVIKNHRFVPSTVEVPARVRIKLIVDNRDSTPEEFESTDLRREKIVPGNTKGIVWVGPLPAGRYAFFGDFHQSTAQGTLVAK